MSDVSASFYSRIHEVLEFEPIDTSTIGDSAILAGIAGQKFIIYSVAVIVAAANAITWKSGATTIIGACPLAANGGYHLESILGIAETAGGDSLVINLSVSTQTGGSITYAQVEA